MANKKQNKWKIDEKDSWAVIYKALNPQDEKWDRNAWNRISHYKKTHQTSKLSLLKGLVIEFGGRPLREILNAEPTDYQRGVHAKCVCGANLTDKSYRLRLKGNSGKEGIEHHVHGKIKSKTLVSQMGRGSKTEFNVGKDCYVFLPEMLSEMGYDELKNISDVKRSRNGKKKNLEDMAILAQSLRDELSKSGIDPKTIGRISGMIGKSGLTAHGLLYELDPGKRNSFANWFREGIKSGSIDNKEIVRAYEKLEDAPYLVSNTELAKLATYSYEFRRFDTKAVIGVEKDDLLYLNSLKEDDELVKEFGKPNIDKHYVRPGTKFKKREGLEDITIREKLEQSHITFLEALGIKLHFPKLEKIRKKVNRKTSDKYGLGIEWNYILKEIKPVFENEKAALHNEYQKFGEIVKEHVLTKEEYFSAKDFFERASIGMKGERENYLRMLSIRQFREMAPKITAMGRKIRMARKEYEKSGNEWTWRDLIKQDYVLKEDFKEASEKTIGMLSDNKILGIKNKNLKKFQETHGSMIGKMYENGLIAKKYISDLKGENAFSRYSKLLEKEKVMEMGGELSKIIESVEPYLKSGLVDLVGNINPFEGISRRFISKDEEWRVSMKCDRFKSLVEYAGIDLSKIDEIKRKISELRKFEGSHYISEGDKMFFSTEYITAGCACASGSFSSIHMPCVNDFLDKIKNSVKVDMDFVGKLIEINDHYKTLKVKESYVDNLIDNLKGERIFAEKRFKEKVEEKYNLLRSIHRGVR